MSGWVREGERVGVRRHESDLTAYNGVCDKVYVIVCVILHEQYCILQKSM